MSPLDEKDLAIMQSLYKFGPKISTKRLSNLLGIAPRTIRYRISRLKEKGVMKPYLITTHERKLGIGDHIVVLQTNPEKEDLLLKLIKAIPYIYSYGSTYGKFNGYLMRFAYSLEKPEKNYEILKTLKKSGYILDYFIFDVIDYQIKNLDLKSYDIKEGWRWDWVKWHTNIISILDKNDVRLNFNFELDVSTVDFDYTDILLLKNLISDASITHKQLRKTMNLSELNISKRIKVLKDKKIIRDFFIDFDLTHSEDFIDFFCFIECSKKVNQILSCLYQIPYFIMILIESPNKFCFQMRLSAKDLKEFLKGFDLLRLYLDSYFFQFVHKQIKENPQYLFDLYNRITGKWEIPIEDYISIIEKG